MVNKNLVHASALHLKIQTIQLVHLGTNCESGKNTHPPSGTNRHSV